MNTKEKILYSALTLFSTKGYSAVSVRQIAAEVGIKASSLYNHFESKQNILNELIKMNIDYIKNFLEKIQLEDMIISKEYTDIELFNNTFINKILKIIKFFLENSNVVKFRKLLTIEQFNDPKMSALYQKIFITDILEYIENFFNCLMNNNIIVKTDPYILALQFYSPIFLLLYNEDGTNKDDYANVEKHIYQFKNTYSMKG